MSIVTGQDIKATGLINMDMIDHEYPERKW